MARLIGGKKSLIKLAMVVTIVLATSLAMPSISEASASGWTFWGGFSVNVGNQSIGIPQGNLYHQIDGKGTYIEADYANFFIYGNLCDTQVIFTYGNRSRILLGSKHSGCSMSGKWGYYIRQNVPKGEACAELWAKDQLVLVAKQCHYVY